MKGFGLALIVLALCAASFLEDAGLVRMATKDAKGWDLLAIFALRGQCEFGDLARRIYGSLKRHVGSRRTKQLVDHCTGRVPWS